LKPTRFENSKRFDFLFYVAAKPCRFLKPTRFETLQKVRLSILRCRKTVSVFETDTV
jgi:acyl-CoA thioesterase FadM